MKIGKQNWKLSTSLASSNEYNYVNCCLLYGPATAVHGRTIHNLTWAKILSTLKFNFVYEALSFNCGRVRFSLIRVKVLMQTHKTTKDLIRL